MNTVRFLQKMKRLLSKPRGWTKLALARNKAGRPVVVSDKSACRFCLLGATDKVRIDNAFLAMNSHLAINALNKICFKEYGLRIVSFNDRKETRKPQVLRVIDKAIALVKAENN